MTHTARIPCLTALICLGLLLSGCGGFSPGGKSPAASAPQAASDAQTVTPEPPSATEDASLIPSVQQGPGNTAANLLHSGIAATGNDGYIYHVDAMLAGNLWRTPTEGGAGQLLLKGRLHDLNVMGDVVFAIGEIARLGDSSSTVSGIIAVRTDGSAVGVVKEGYFEELIAYDQYLYYADVIEGGLYRMRYDGSECTLLLADIYDHYAIVDGMLYLKASLDEQYIGSIYRMPPDGSAAPERIVNETFGGAFDVMDGCICFIDRESATQCMYLYDTRTGETRFFIDRWADSLNGEGSSLYYFWYGVRQDRSDMGLYRANADGSGATLLLSANSAYDINIAGGRMFWHTNDEQRRLSFVDIGGSGDDVQFVPMAQDEERA